MTETSTQIRCDLCGNQTDGYVCRPCTDITAGYLRLVADLAGEVETNVARLARYATRGGRRAARADEADDHGGGPAHRRQPVRTFGWPASKDRPKRGALHSTQLPVDLGAATRAAHAFNAVTTWARTVEDERGLQVPVTPGDHPAAAAAAFLLGQLDWIRTQQFADEANEQMRAAGATIRRIVDAPPEREVVGRCDCGAYLYAIKGASTVTCEEKTCGLLWVVESSRADLIEELRGYLLTASEAAGLLVFFGEAADRRRLAKTITMWAQRSHLVSKGEVDGAPVYVFGDVLDRATRTAAEVGA